MNCSLCRILYVHRALARTVCEYSRVPLLYSLQFVIASVYHHAFALKFSRANNVPKENGSLSISELGEGKNKQRFSCRNTKCSWIHIQVFLLGHLLYLIVVLRLLCSISLHFSLVDLAGRCCTRPTSWLIYIY